MEGFMLFNSLHFAIFLPIVFGIYWALPHKFRWPILLLASYYFYMSWNASYVVLILFTTAVSYFVALSLERIKGEKGKRTLLFLTLFVCLGILFVFKYFNFFAESFSAITSRLGIPLHPITLKLLLPVGISFYTFQTLGYVIDVYRGNIEAEHNFGVYAAFVSFFPQLVAGPIERTKNLLPQIKAEHKFDYALATNGLKLMAWGFYKKLVIADFLSPFVDKVFGNIYSYHGFSLVLAIFFFSIQIYCDFSGYSDIAKGTANLFGIDLIKNFNSPYFSSSIHEFWSRWHISLSTWFKDYVYIPLGGNRVSKIRHYRNLLITFLVSGLWHGANWTFVIWGGLHGVAQIAENRLGLRRDLKRGAVAWWARVFLVFCFVMVAWVFFRAQNVNEAFYCFQHMFDGISSPIEYLYCGFSERHNGIGITKNTLVRIAGSMALLAMFDYVSLKTDIIDWLNKKPTVTRHTFYCAIILIVAFFHAVGEVAFVYFQF